MKEEAATKQVHLLCSDNKFDFRSNCVFCGKTTEPKQFHDKSQLNEINSAIQNICAQFQRNDSWFHSVMVRIYKCIPLFLSAMPRGVAVASIYVVNQLLNLTLMVDNFL